jgi:hypothetical protein|nr:MAG TPA: Protein of unknown function (DUF2500) [Caudoviricetes sp.]
MSKTSKVKRTERAKTFFIIYLVIGMAFAIFLVYKFSQSFPIELNNGREQTAQAKIIEKRIIRDYSSGNGHVRGRTFYEYRIFYEFSDGSVKEFEVDRVWVSGSSNTSPYSPVYDELKEGDNGLLTYKEIENNEQKYNEALQYQGRKFISFEKDAEYGGTKVKMIKRTDNKSVIVILCFFFAYIIACVMLLVWGKKDKLSNKQKREKQRKKQNRQKNR